jgi:hypothetical protein
MAAREDRGFRPTVKERQKRIRKARTVKGVIAAMGGVAEVSKIVGIRHPSVCEWVRENRIPRDRVVELAQSFRVARAVLNRFVSIR